MEIENVTQEKLTALQGMSLRLWHFTPTKDMLTFMIPGDKDRFLICLLCETIKTHAVWIVDNPTLIKLNSESVKIVDTELEIVCQEIVFNDEYFREQK